MITDSNFQPQRDRVIVKLPSGKQDNFSGPLSLKINFDSFFGQLVKRACIVWKKYFKRQKNYKKVQNEQKNLITSQKMFNKAQRITSIFWVHSKKLKILLVDEKTLKNDCQKLKTQPEVDGKGLCKIHTVAIYRKKVFMYRKLQTSPLCKFSYHPPHLNHLTKFLQPFISH